MTPATDVTLTIRPLFCFIIWRKAALLQLNTLLRFCSMMTSKSSSVMEASKLS